MPSFSFRSKAPTGARFAKVSGSFVHYCLLFRREKDRVAELLNRIHYSLIAQDFASPAFMVFRFESPFEPTERKSRVPRDPKNFARRNSTRKRISLVSLGYATESVIKLCYSRYATSCCFLSFLFHALYLNIFSTT